MLKVFLKICFFTALTFSRAAYASLNVEKIRGEYERALQTPFSLLPHKPNYLLPLSYQSNPHQSIYENVLSASDIAENGEYNEKAEVNFQISFSILAEDNIFGSGRGLFFAYTQQSWWQMYNSSWSRPFRETNYSPEFFVRRVLDKPHPLLGGLVLAYDLGVIHESNGEIQALSRSWNRVFFRFVWIKGNTLVKTSLWHRLPESEKPDDNADILDFMGNGEIEIEQFFNKGRLKLKLIPGYKRQGAQLFYSYPFKNNLRFFVKASIGYGSSLGDYMHRNNTVGVGVTLDDLLGALVKKPK
ncbi:MAG: phospholipase A [Bdellovibrionales bacterium]